MKIRVFLSTRSKGYDAKGILNEKSIVVLKGSRIKTGDPINYRFSPAVVNAWNDRSVVGKDGIILQDIAFKSATAAAQFVTKNSVNGWKAWKTEDGDLIKTVKKGD